MKWNFACRLSLYRNRSCVCIIYESSWYSQNNSKSVILHYRGTTDPSQKPLLHPTLEPNNGDLWWRLITCLKHSYRVREWSIAYQFNVYRYLTNEKPGKCDAIYTLVWVMLDFPVNRELTTPSFPEWTRNLDAELERHHSDSMSEWRRYRYRQG